MSTKTFSVLWVLVALMAAVLKVAYMFFPAPYVSDLILFGVLGAVAGYRRPSIWRRLVVIAVAPTLTVVVYILLKTATLPRLREGIGTAWVVSIPLIVAAAFLSGWIGSRAAARREVGSTATS